MARGGTATVLIKGDVVAREVLLADGADLVRCRSRRQGKESDAHLSHDVGAPAVCASSGRAQMVRPTMKIGDRERMVNRVRQIRRVVGTPGSRPEPPPAGDSPGPDPVRVSTLEARIAHLEQLLEGLQDSVHRESRRQDQRITELETQIQPAALGEALSRDARDRGL
jgi:hypothetical protein